MIARFVGPAFGVLRRMALRAVRGLCALGVIRVPAPASGPGPRLVRAPSLLAGGTAPTCPQCCGSLSVRLYSATRHGCTEGATGRGSHSRGRRGRGPRAPRARSARHIASRPSPAQPASASASARCGEQRRSPGSFRPFIRRFRRRGGKRASGAVTVAGPKNRWSSHAFLPRALSR